jgi:hypothetical protein
MVTMRAHSRFSVGFLLGLAVALGAAPAFATPDLTAVAPQGFQRGTEAVATFSGARLAEIQQLLLYSPGVEVLGFEEAKDNQFQAKLKIAPDCRMGIHAVRARTTEGVSDLITFFVGPFPEAAETEPNNEFTAPQVIQPGLTVSGVIQNEDQDFFVIEAKKGQRIAAELEGLRQGRAFFDPYLAILNSERFELARSDDTALLWQDPVCSIIAPEDGKYIIQVRESAFGGNGNCTYRLHVGNYPRPRAVYPAGGKPGQTLEVTWLGDPAGPRKETITIPADAKGDYELFAKDEQGISPSPNVIRVLDLESALEVEPNNDLQHATPFTGPGAANGIVQADGDVDFFKFTAAKGQAYDVRVYARKPLRSPLDPVLVVRRANGAGIGSNDDSGGPDAYLRFTAPENEDVVLEIRDHLNKGGETYVYRIEVTPVVPELTMTLPERRQYVATTLNIPRGNRTAILVAASRANFGGDLNVTFEGLPPGVTVETIPMAGNRSDIPVLFTAAPDAPLAGALVDIIGRPADPNLKIEGHLKQRTMLVRGQNNVDVWGHDADRMATAVNEESPFTLEIVQPKVPLVRNGSMDLKVVAKRSEGFTAPISVRLLYNPPGISSSGSVQIPEGQNEAIIPLTANGNAEIRTWKIVATGFSGQRGRRGGGGGGGEFSAASSQLADLNVTDRFFDFAFVKAAGEQGQETEVVVNVTKKQDWEGPCKVELVGLPAGAATEPVEITKDSTTMTFKVKLAADAREGRHQTLLCNAVITQDGEPIKHTLGTGELRIDKPLPPKVAAAPPPAAQPMPQPMPAAQPEKKVLSRLEQLRLQKAQASK